MAIGRNWRVGADTLNTILYRRQVNKKTEAIADFEKFIILTDNPQLVEKARQKIDELSQ